MCKEQVGGKHILSDTFMRNCKQKEMAEEELLKNFYFYLIPLIQFESADFISIINVDHLRKQIISVFTS